MRLKTILDYYLEMYEEYPDVPKEDIRRILQYGWKLLYLHNSYGCDVEMSRNNFWFYSGRLFKDSLLHFFYYQKKLKTKLRILFKRNKTIWDGYYYFALFEKKYNDYLAQKNKRGRKRKKFTFEKVIMYKLYEECLVESVGAKAIFRFPITSDLGFTCYYEKLVTDKAELLDIKVPKTMKDILTSNYEYLIIKNKKYKL